MALSTLLEIGNRAADELSIAHQSAYIGSIVPDARTLLACANAAGRDLMRAHDWGALQALGTITTANGTSSYPLAADFDRMISDSGWDRSNDWMMVGPDTPQINRYLNESGVAQTGLRKRFRLQGASIVIFPIPAATETLVYEYVSNQWARSSIAVAQTEFAADTDTTVFDPDLMRAEIKWRYLAKDDAFNGTDNTGSSPTGITASGVVQGSDAPHNNVQPTIILNKIVFTGVYS